MGLCEGGGGKTEEAGTLSPGNEHSDMAWRRGAAAARCRPGGGLSNSGNKGGRAYQAGEGAGVGQGTSGAGTWRGRRAVWGRGAGKSVRGDALQTSQGFFFYGGSTAAVVVADIVSAAAEVVSMLAEGSICRVLLILIYPVFIKIILRPQGIVKASLWYKTQITRTTQN